MINIKKSFMRSFNTLRKTHEYTLKNLTEFTHINSANLRSYSIGQRLPSLDKLRALNKLYSVPLDYLILNKTNRYLNSIKLLSLGALIDKFPDSFYRNHVEEHLNFFLDEAKETSQFDTSEKYNFDGSIHDNIRSLRSAHDISQREFSKQILGVESTSKICLYEKKYNPPLKYLVAMAQFAGTSIHWLVTGEPLVYEFENRHLKEKLLLLDRLADFKNINSIASIMQKILDKAEAKTT